MKIKTSIIIGVTMLIIAIGFVAFAMSHPELSFPWGHRSTFMLYGAYIWFVFRFLIDIPILRKNKEDTGVCCKKVKKNGREKSFKMYAGRKKLRKHY